MPKAELDNGIRLHYQQVGHGPDVVMVHGITGNLAVWHLHIVPALSDRFRLTTYDLRGHGHSDVAPTGYSPDDMAGDLLQLLDLLEIHRPALDRPQLRRRHRPVLRRRLPVAGRERDRDRIRAAGFGGVAPA